MEHIMDFFSKTSMILTTLPEEEVAQLFLNTQPVKMLVDPDRPTKNNEPPADGPLVEPSSTKPLINVRSINANVLLLVLAKCLVLSFPSRMHDPLGPAQLIVMLLVNSISLLK